MRNVEGLLITRTEVSEIKCAHRTQNKKKQRKKHKNTTKKNRNCSLWFNYIRLVRRYKALFSVRRNIDKYVRCLVAQSAHDVCASQHRKYNKKRKKNLKNVVSVLIDEKIYHTIYNSQWKLFSASLYIINGLHTVCFIFSRFLFLFLTLCIWEQSKINGNRETSGNIFIFYVYTLCGFRISSTCGFWLSNLMDFPFYWRKFSALFRWYTMQYCQVEKHYSSHWM